MKAYVCNKCGRVITNEKIMSDMLRLSISNDKVGKYDEVHLCADCDKKFCSFLHDEESEDE